MTPKDLLLVLRNCKALVNLKQVHAQVLTQGLLYDNQSLACKLLNGYVRLGNPQDAHNVFDYIPDPDIVSYTSLINLYLHIQLPNQAFSVFSELVNKGLSPDSYAVVGALSACGRSRTLLYGKVVHGMIVKYQLGLNRIVGNALIDMYCRNGRIEIAQFVFKQMGTKDVASWTSLLNGFVLCNDIESARRVFDEMPLRNDVAWTAMIMGYVRGKMSIQGLEIFKLMKADGENQPTVIAIVAVLSGCADLGAFDHGQAVHCYLSKVNLDKDATVSNALMVMYSKVGCLELAAKIFDGMEKKDGKSWTTMISGYAFHGKGNIAVRVFYDMLESGAIPDDVMFLLVLSACSHSGLVVEAKRLFNRMSMCYGLEPKIEHYGCMVDLLGRAGLLEEAKEFVYNMHIEPDTIIWRSLLGACLKHGNLDLAEIAGKKIIELEPHDDGVYVLLCNMYRAANRMEDAKNMRKMMGDQKVKKKPAWSSIEVNGVVNEFHAKHATHHASTQIYMLLEMIAEHLKLGFDYSLLEID